MEAADKANDEHEFEDWNADTYLKSGHSQTNVTYSCSKPQPLFVLLSACNPRVGIDPIACYQISGNRQIPKYWQQSLVFHFLFIVLSLDSRANMANRWSKLGVYRSNETYADLTVVTDDNQTFRLHRVVVCAMSLYFETACNSNFQVCTPC